MRSQKIAALRATMQPQEAAAIFWDELEMEDIDQIAAVRRQQPARSSSSQPARYANSGPARSNGPLRLTGLSRFSLSVLT